MIQNVTLFLLYFINCARCARCRLPALRVNALNVLGTLSQMVAHDTSIMQYKEKSGNSKYFSFILKRNIIYRRESRILFKFEKKWNEWRRGVAREEREREREKNEGELDSGWGIDFLSSSSTTFRPSGGVPTLWLKSSQETRERKSKESTISHISYRGRGRAWIFLRVCKASRKRYPATSGESFSQGERELRFCHTKQGKRIQVLSNRNPRPCFISIG